MNCIPEGVLRAYVDHELEPAEVALVETHLRECSPCQTHAAELSAARLRVGERLGALEESPRSLGEDNPQSALSRFKANLPLPSGPQEPAGDSLRVGMFAGQRRFAWAAAADAASSPVGAKFCATAALHVAHRKSTDRRAGLIVV